MLNQQAYFMLIVANFTFNPMKFQQPT